MAKDRVSFIIKVDGDQPRPDRAGAAPAAARPALGTAYVKAAPAAALTRPAAAAPAAAPGPAFRPKAAAGQGDGRDVLAALARTRPWLAPRPAAAAARPAPAAPPGVTLRPVEPALLTGARQDRLLNEVIVATRGRGLSVLPAERPGQAKPLPGPASAGGGGGAAGLAAAAAAASDLKEAARLQKEAARRGLERPAEARRVAYAPDATPPPARVPPAAWVAPGVRPAAPLPPAPPYGPPPAPGTPAGPGGAAPAGGAAVLAAGQALTVAAAAFDAAADSATAALGDGGLAAQADAATEALAKFVPGLAAVIGFASDRLAKLEKVEAQVIKNVRHAGEAAARVISTDFAQAHLAQLKKTYEEKGAGLLGRLDNYLAGRARRIAGLEAYEGMKASAQADAARLAPYSGALSAAQARADAMRVRGDARAARTHGESLGRFVTGQAQYEMAMQRALAPVKEATLRQLTKMTEQGADGKQLFALMEKMKSDTALLNSLKDDNAAFARLQKRIADELKRIRERDERDDFSGDSVLKQLRDGVDLLPARGGDDPAAGPPAWAADGMIRPLE